MSELRVVVWDDYNKAVLEDDLTGPFKQLTFSSSLHGGFKECKMLVPMPLERVWLYLERELPGRHFHHIEVLENTRVVWEGRIMDLGLVAEPSFVGLSLMAMGYWSSCRDQMYDPDDSGNTNWKSGGPHTIDGIIKEMLTNSCPDIATDQTGIEANTRDVVGLDIDARAYPMDNIVDKLAPLSDSDNSVWYFAVWDGRRAYWTKRTIAQVDYYIYLEDTQRLTLTQQGKHVRNRIIPKVGSTEGTALDDLPAQANAPTPPRRDLLLTLPTGTPSGASDDARQTALDERKAPRQDTSFTVKGRVYTTAAGSAGPGSGNMVQTPKWRVRAGHVLRLQDLLPASVASVKLDDLRTFYIQEARYDAVRDVLNVQPDRPAARLGTLLARIAQLERDK
jgi:hypothetical protein